MVSEQCSVDTKLTLILPGPSCLEYEYSLGAGRLYRGWPTETLAACMSKPHSIQTMHWLVDSRGQAITCQPVMIWAFLRNELQVLLTTLSLQSAATAAASMQHCVSSRISLSGLWQPQQHAGRSSFGEFRSNLGISSHPLPMPQPSVSSYATSLISVHPLLRHILPRHAHCSISPHLIL